MDLPETLQPTELPSPQAKKFNWMIPAVISSSLLLLIQIVRWPLIDTLTVFVEPLFEVGFFLAFLTVTLLCFVHALRNRRRRWKDAWPPFLICAATASVVCFTPFDSLYLKANFHTLKDRRTAVARQILAHEAGTIRQSGACGDFTALAFTDSMLSEGGEVVVDHQGEKSFTLFLTFRGILEHFAGFVYSPSDEPPAKTQFCGDGREIERVAPNWFWYSS